MSSRKTKLKNWEMLKNQGYKDRVKNREVHATQDMKRGERGVMDKPVRERVLALTIAGIFGILGFLVGSIGMVIWSFFQFVKTSNGSSFLDFNMDQVHVLLEWPVYALAGFSFLITWLIANEKLMASWRSKNSMNDSTDINTYENDQHIMLPEEMQRMYDWFPDAGAHSSVQVSSMLSHMMLDKKGLKQVDVTIRHNKDVKDPGKVVLYKDEPVTNEQGDVVTSKMPMIDEAFGQELFTASGIPVSEKDIRKPLDVRKIEYNPVDETKNRKDRDKLPYDTVADLINNDWEFPDYEVQRPAGAYLVDTAPVNTMV